MKDSSRGEEGWLRDRGAGLFRMLEVRNFKASVGPKTFASTSFIKVM